MLFPIPLFSFQILYTFNEIRREHNINKFYTEKRKLKKKNYCVIACFYSNLKRDIK